jgi:hypothetical protein
MARRTAGWLGWSVVGVALGVAGFLIAEPARTAPGTVPTAARVAGPGRSRADALTREALVLHTGQEFAAPCDRFTAAVDDEPSALRREDVGRCFESWGWHALRDGRAEEAMALFQQGLRELPGSPGLLRGLGLSAVHADRVDEALAPLEQAADTAGDMEVRLLLAHLWDRRDDAGRAAAHVRAALVREPGHDAARRLLAKLDREARVETAFVRIDRPQFVVKAPPGLDVTLRDRVLGQLDAAREHVARTLGRALPGRAIVVLYRADEFQRVTGVHGWANGAFDGKIRLLIATALPPPGELERLIVHEYAHAVIHERSYGRAPRWLQEGLAQVLDGSTADPMLRVPAQPTLAGIEALIADADPARARTGYDLALWVVTDLADRGGMVAMGALLDRLREGEPLGEAMGRVWGLRASELEHHWRRVLGG